MDDYRFIDTKKFREWIKRCKCIERYEWYKRDLRRKRPNRKKGRDLYHGILTYRRRVGQHEGRLSFRGVAEMYDKLRIKVIRQHPELAEKIPDLYIRFLSLRFPPHEFEAQLYAKPKPLTESIMDRFYHGLGSMRIKLPPLMAGELAGMLDGKDTILARLKDVEPTDAVVSFALAMLRDEKKSNNK